MPVPCCHLCPPLREASRSLAAPAGGVRATRAWYGVDRVASLLASESARAVGIGFFFFLRSVGIWAFVCRPPPLHRRESLGS